ncbi:MAG: hypothetical protein JST78_06180 [Bacteroidetes bacterium]|nr:hypothetical protein [Bacteroidota bacterium]
MESQDWINSVLNSTNGHQKAVPRKDLFMQIQARVADYEPISTKILWLAAASLLLLIGLNFRTLWHSQHPTKSAVVQVMAADVNKSNQLYSHE